MTKRRPSNKKPSGLNKSLGNSLSNDREKTRKCHRRAKYDANEIENPAFMEQEINHYIDSVTDETSLEEFLAKAELAGTEFTAEKEQFKIIEKNSAVVIPKPVDYKNNLELQWKNEHRLRIPRRPARELWENMEELTKLENEAFLEWRSDLSELQEVDGLVLTPYERNPDMWRELWRVVEKSDIIVQIVDARNPLLFRSKDLDRYVKEVDLAKQLVLLVNKADLLKEEQLQIWTEYFKKENINVIFWSAIDDDKPEPTDKDDLDVPPSTSTSNLFITNKDELIASFKKLGHASDDPSLKPVVVGMVGYPNVGKSSTINKLAGGKKVSVSATPGKTRHFQTIHIDSQLCLCDCPGLVMPSFSFGRSEMFLNGILPIDQMRDHFGPTSLLLSRVPTHVIEAMYSIMLPETSDPSAVNLLNSLAFMRGFMASSGIPDASRAARLMLKDVVNGKLMWAAAPPNVDQEVFDQFSYPKKENRDVGRVQMEKLVKLQLLEGNELRGSQFDSQHFSGSVGTAHVKDSKALPQKLGTVVPTAPDSSNGKKHFKGKKDKLRRIYNE
uniref:Large subunit GTPase 1 homolog n=1 Tax=Caenorhabditis japonica TaxID=281687 RepID=A0A8R1HN89_CAEJA